MAINVEDILRKNFKVERAPELSDCWRYYTSTPAHTFNSYIRRASGEERFYQTTIRDHDDKDWVLKLLKIIEEKESYLSEPRHIWIIDGVYNEKYGFDSLAVISPSCHRTFIALDRELNDKTFVFFPIKRFEFSGDEDPEVIMEMRDRYVSTIDWKRSVYPKILMRYDNKYTSSRSKGRIKGKVGKSLILARPETLYREIDNLTLADGDGSFVEIENYLGEFCRLEYQNGAYLATIKQDNAGQTQISRTLAHQWVDSFLKGTRTK